MAKGRKRRSSARAKGAVAAAVILGVVVIGYGIMCAVGSDGDTFRKNTAVNGVSLEGLTLDQARTALDERFAGETSLQGVSYAKLTVTPDLPEQGESYVLDISKALVWDFADTLQRAYEQQRGGHFLRQGINLVLGGKSETVLPYVEEGEALDTAMEECGILALDTSVNGAWEQGEDELTITKGKDGFRVDQAALVEAVVSRTKAGDYEPFLCVVEETKGAGLDLNAIYETIYTEKTDPTITVAEDRSYEVVEAVRGVDLDLASAESEIAEAEEGSTFTLPLIITEPSMTTDEFTECLFRDELGSYTTNVSGSSARRSNVKLAGQKCDGYILLPGEEFAYNEVVGKRTAEAGFKEAPAYQNGETVNELGGGVCQVSSTLYCACMYADLEITLRRNHTYVSSYVPIGMDATVSWGGPDYKFVNNTDFPILLRSNYENDRLTFWIYGTDVDHYHVEITSETISVKAAPEKRVNDPTMWEGETSVKSSGHTGYIVQTYRHVYDQDGNLVREGEEAYSNYSTQDKIILVGTKKKPEPPVEKPENNETGSGETGSAEAGSGETGSGSAEAESGETGSGSE